MGVKPPLVVLSFVLCASGSTAMAGEEALPLDAGGTPPIQSSAESAVPNLQGAYGLPSVHVGMAWAGPMALSVSERLELRDEIRKAGQDIYSEYSADAPDQNDTRAVVTRVSR